MVAHDDFFQTKKPAAVLKHGILSRYPQVFASMTGSQGTGRVVYFDGYAGPGRYEGGAPGSPLLAIQTAQRSAAFGRDVECLFCERDPDVAANLQRTLTAEAPEGLRYQVWTGDVEDWAVAAVGHAGDDPMFTFLDPFGNGLAFEVLVDKLLGRGVNQTEVLLNMNLEAVWRIGGLLSGAVIEENEATLSRVDRFLGGDWWREEFRVAREQLKGGEDAAAARAARHVADRFCQLVKARTGFKAFKVEVRRRPTHQPLFLLVLFYRHRKAPWKFNEAVSLANADWRRACAREDLDKSLARTADEDGGLFSVEEFAEMMTKSTEKQWDIQEKQLSAQWITDITANIADLLGVKAQVVLADRVSEVYGATMGLARDKHVAAAWKALAKDGQVEPRPVGAKHLDNCTILRTPAHS